MSKLVEIMKPKITQNELKSLLYYDPETGIFTWKIKPSPQLNIGSIAGCLAYGCIQIRIKARNYQAHILAWLYMNGSLPKDRIKHINNNRYDNRISNLQDSTHSMAMHNRIKFGSINKTGFSGVSMSNNKLKYVAVISVNCQSKNLGSFDTPEEAHDVYKRAKIALHEGLAI